MPSVLSGAVQCESRLSRFDDSSSVELLSLMRLLFSYSWFPLYIDTPRTFVLCYYLCSACRSFSIVFSHIFGLILCSRSRLGYCFRFSSYLSNNRLRYLCLSLSPLFCFLLRRVMRMLSLRLRFFACVLCMHLFRCDPSRWFLACL